MTGAVSPDGKAASDHLTEKVREHRKTKKHLKTEFGVDFLRLYPSLKPKSMPELDIPDPPEPVAPAILEYLAILHNKNPAVRKSEPMTSYIKFRSEPFNATEAIGLLDAFAESPVVTRKRSVQLYGSLLYVLARQRLDPQLV